MSRIVGSIRHIGTIKALRGDTLKIDLGKIYTGILTAWMKKDPNASTYREFSIESNRYLVLSGIETSDYYTGENVLYESIEGKWYFDVEKELDGNKRTIYTGTILFKNDITGSVAQLVSPAAPIDGLYKDGYRWRKGVGNTDLVNYEVGDEIEGVGTLFPGYWIHGLISVAPMTDASSHITILNSAVV